MQIIINLLSSKCFFVYSFSSSSHDNWMVNLDMWHFSLTQNTLLSPSLSSVGIHCCQTSFSWINQTNILIFLSQAINLTCWYNRTIIIMSRCFDVKEVFANITKARLLPLVSYIQHKTTAEFISTLLFHACLWFQLQFFRFSHNKANFVLLTSNVGYRILLVDEIRTGIKDFVKLMIKMIVITCIH